MKLQKIKTIITCLKDINVFSGVTISSLGIGLLETSIYIFCVNL